jgi:hypothetical protein
MGTNYYLHENPPCIACGHEDEPLHIGKSSGGWCFALHVDPENGINDLPDWEDRWSKPGAVIKDEYGKSISPAEMEMVILARICASDVPFEPEFLESNHAVPGPYGLLRSKIEPNHCIGHGGGTYDLIVCEFS